jgi:hypothetical protein
LEGHYLLKPNLNCHEYVMLKYERKAAADKKDKKGAQKAVEAEDDDDKY